MKSLLVLLSLVAAGSCAVLDPKCAWGESYWCSDLRTAKSCGAIAHCKTTVWMNQVQQPASGEVCEFCVSIVSDVKKFIDDKRTETDIAHFMTLACGIIPSANLSAECKSLINGYIQEIIDCISSGLDGQRICSLLLLCPGGAVDTVAHAPLSPASSVGAVEVVRTKKIPSGLVGVNSEPVCGDCKKFFNDIKNMITSNHSESQLEQLIDMAVCSLLGSLEDECKSLIHEFLPEILQILSTYYDPNMICGSIGVCSLEDMSRAKNMFLRLRLSKLPLYRIAKQSSTETCLMCKTVMTELQTLDRDKNVQDEVTNFVKNQLCAKLGSIKVECEITVDLYGPELFQLLATELDPSTRCQSLGFCTSLIHAPALPATVVAVVPPVKITKRVRGAAECEMCKMIVKEIQSFITTNATEQEILAALDKVCSLFPSAVAAQCKGFVDLYGPAFIELFLQEVDPNVICQTLGVCSSTFDVPQPIKVVLLPAKEKSSGSVKDSNECEFCKMVVAEVQALIATNATEQEIITELEKACAILPKTYADECKTFVDTYGPKIIEMILGEVTPDVICEKLGFCTASSSVKLQQPIKDSETCLVCKTIVQYLEALLEQNATIQEIEAVLDKICNFLPETMKAQCTDIVAQYGPLIVQYITTLESPEQVCTMVKACTSGVDSKPLLPKKAHPERKPVGSVECTNGATYWCQSRENAEKCHAVDYCKNYVWKN